MQIAAILLAAGEGRRIGGPKALLRIGAETFLARCGRALARPGIARLIVVLGHDAERVAALAGVPPDAQLVTNVGYRQGGMLSSILCGLDAADAFGAEAVLVHPVDHPLVEPETVDRVAEALTAGARIAVPSHAGRRGHPGGFAGEVWPLLRAAPRDRGARAVLHDHPELIVHVEGGRGCVAGVDTPADYAAVTGVPARRP